MGHVTNSSFDATTGRDWGPSQPSSARRATSSARSTAGSGVGVITGVSVGVADVVAVAVGDGEGSPSPLEQAAATMRTANSESTALERIACLLGRRR